ncbi:MAG: FG-GAP repeat protein [Planctomycetes bacterium]|nr:FG-GAP repeat protein [Planctomycetota bacterium]
MLHALLIVFGLACSAQAAGGASRQAPEFDYDIGKGDGFGYRTANLGDLDGDGVPDCIVGNPWCHASGVARRAWVFSGIDGSVLWEFVGPVVTDEERRTRPIVGQFASGVRGAGDVDLDGTPDVLLFAGDRELSVLSGKTGDVLHAFPCPQPSGTLLGMASPFLGIGDVDRDGHADVAVGRAVRSGLDGTLLFELELELSDEDAPFGLHDVGDVDRDGWTDLAAGFPTEVPGRVVVLSGRDGRRVVEWHGLAHLARLGDETSTASGPERGFGFQVASAGDVDCDGAPELLVGSCASGQGWDRMLTFSARSGDRLSTFHSPGGYPTNAAFAAGDLDGDELVDFAVPGCSGTSGVAVLSASTRRVLWDVSVDDDGPWDSWGKLARVECAGDIDRDGVGDLLVSVLQDASPGLPGYVLVLSGRDGRRIRKYDTPSSLCKVGKRR